MRQNHKEWLSLTGLYQFIDSGRFRLYILHHMYRLKLLWTKIELSCTILYVYRHLSGSEIQFGVFCSRVRRVIR